jgi:hypothetical protein
MPKINPTQFKVSAIIENKVVLCFFVEINHPLNFVMYKKFDKFVRNKKTVPDNVEIWFSKRKVKFNKNRNIQMNV